MNLIGPEGEILLVRLGDNKPAYTGQRVLRQRPRYGKRRVNGRVVRAVLETITRGGEITALDIIDGISMARVRYDGGAVDWEATDMLKAEAI